MIKVDLFKSSGLPLFFENGMLLGYDDAIVEKKDYSVNELRLQLLNSEIDCVDTFFCKYSKIFPETFKDIEINSYVVFPNLAGIEYAKTKACVSSTNSLYEVIYGGGVILLQNFTKETQGKVYTSVLKKGMKFLIPAGYEFSISNTKISPLIIIEYFKKGSKLNDTLDDMKGMAYYVIRKNAKYEIVKNPHYRFVDEIIKYSWEKINKNFGITSKTPLKKQLTKNNEKIATYFNSTSVSL